MISKEFVIQFAEGLHARPASELVRACQNNDCKIKLSKGAVTVDPKSILGILSIGAAKGDKVVLEVEGPSEKEVFAKLEAFFLGN